MIINANKTNKTKKTFGLSVMLQVSLGNSTENTRGNFHVLRSSVAVVVVVRETNLFPGVKYAVC